MSEWRKVKNILEENVQTEKKNENKFIPIQRIFHIAYCTLFCLTHKSIANSLLLWLYIIPYVIVECVTSCAIQAKMSLRLSFFFFLLAVVPHICDDVHLYVGEWRGWNVRRIRREKETAKKEKFSSTSFIFGVAAAMDSKCYFILYAETVSCSLFFIVHYLWKSINSQNTIFYIQLEIFFLLYIA